jgi:predicted nucleic acid-binding Zn ribbon protein
MPGTDIEKPEKLCLECNEPLGPGREDRKFCNDVCRTAYNNRRRKEPAGKEPAEPSGDNPAFQHIYQILVKNRDTLMFYDCYKEEPHTIRDLQGHGFNLKYFTSEYHMEDIGIFKFCFDYGYHITEIGRVYIIEHSDEIFC